MSSGLGIGSWFKKTWNSHKGAIVGSVLAGPLGPLGTLGGMQYDEARKMRKEAEKAAENAITPGVDVDNVGAMAQADEAGDEEANLKRRQLAANISRGRQGTIRTNSLGGGGTL